MTGFPRLYAIVDRATLDARGVSVRQFARELREAGVGLVQYRDKYNGPQEILRAAWEIDAAFEGVEVIRVMNDRADLAVLAGWDGVHVGQGDLGVEAVRRVFDPTHHAMRPRDEWGTRDYESSKESRFPSGMTERKATAKSKTTRPEVGAIVGISTHNEEQVRVAVEPTSQKGDVGHPEAVQPMSQNRDMGHPDSLPEYVAVGPVFGTVSKANAEPVVGLELVRKARALTELPIVAIGGITLANAHSVVEAGADSVAVIGGLFVEGRAVREVARDFLEMLE